jgi:hypothetical protein
MMKASPSAAFEMPEPDLLLELLIVALDPPAQFGEFDQALKGDIFGKGRASIWSAPVRLWATRSAAILPAGSGCA